MSKKNKHQKIPKQSETQSSSLVKSVLQSHTVQGLRIVLDILGIVMTFLFFYPRITADFSSSWDLTNPLQSSFKIKNESNIGCYSIKCTFGSSVAVHSDATLNVPEVHEIPELCPDKSSTIPAPNVLSTAPNAIDDAEVYINLTYRPLLIPITFSTKSYRFKARKTPSGYIWEHMYMDRKVK